MKRLGLLIFWGVFACLCRPVFAAKPAVAPPPVPEASSASDQQMQKLLGTLNETLEENRKIRENIKILQTSLQAATIENARLKSDMQGLQAISVGASRDLESKNEELQKELEKLRADLKEIEKDKLEIDHERKNMNSEASEVRDENEKLKGLLSRAVLAEEKEEILGLVETNRQSVSAALEKLSGVQSEAELLKSELNRVHYNFGNVLFSLHDYKQAAEHYLAALRWNPSNPWAHYNLGIIYDYYLHDKDLALRHYQKYVDYKPADENESEARRRILDLNLLKKVQPTHPLKVDLQEIEARS